MSIALEGSRSALPIVCLIVLRNSFHLRSSGGMLIDMELRPVTDEHFAAMIDGKVPISTLRIPPNGVDNPAILKLLRGVASDMLERGLQGSWKMVTEGEVVGLCGFKGIPSPKGSVEIGYGVAPERRRRGYAT